MCLKRVNIYADANEYFTLLKYLGLNIYSLPTRKQSHLIISKISIAIAVISFLMFALTLISCNVLCLHGRNNTIESRMGVIIYICMDLEIVIIIINSHCNSRRLYEIFRRFEIIDRKLQALTETNVLIMKKRSNLHFASKFRYTLSILTFIFDMILMYNSNREQLPPGILFCTAIPQISNVYRTYGVSLFIFFLNECTDRVKYISNAIDALMLLKQRIVCIETSIAPKADVVYKLDAAKHLLSTILDAVTKINKTFQFHLMIKLMHAAAILLLTAYNTANIYLINNNIIAEIDPIIGILYILAHVSYQIIDFLIDIWFYKTLQNEVIVIQVYNEVFNACLTKYNMIFF